MAAKEKPVKPKQIRQGAKKLPQWIKDSPIAVDRRGRALTESEVQTIQTMAEMQCSSRMISAVLGVHHSTICENYADIIEEAKDKGKKLLLHCLWEKATVEKDTKMQIWLSKQFLGFKESWPEVPATMNYNVNIMEVPR